MRQYDGVLFESFTDPASKISSAIRDATSSFERTRSGDKIFKNISKARCPVCRELIENGAKKCPMCHEFIGSENRP
mgnify:FL=1|jgi:hypothetical protein